MRSGSGKNVAGCSPVDLLGLWKPPGAGRVCGQKFHGVWLSRTKWVYGEFCWI
ncbi:hypothetical protein MFUM_1020041 [Methylacidiphilum fumariolicum SolV]|uniref:Uncharacterized protein n=2 Tax=Candidatus Methylacidiphilum fumarolicum TaxID=591154 RepID=I0JVP8_METFB|nr:conserved protein of unknown function [Candidatus Methylacidiphilum fumarolicum]CCG91317.1 hypothetical protein MFUM_1020041 [Methylacidiphilum fumariolicum SolV]